MIIAMNITESLPMLMPAVRQAAKRGTKLITIDPRMTECARISDLWLQVRPGTDVALLLGWINLVIKEKLYDEDFITNWTNAPFLVRTDTNETLREKDIIVEGKSERFVVWDSVTSSPVVWDPRLRDFAKKDVSPSLEGTYDVTGADGSKVRCKTVWTLLVERVEPYTAEYVEKITSVSTTKFKLAGQWYATLKPSQLVFGGHVHDSFAPGSIDANRSKCILRTITGNLDTSEMVAGPLYPDKFVTDYEMELKTDEMMPPEQKKKQIGGDRFRLLAFAGYDLKSKYQKKTYGVATNAQWSCQGHPPMYWRTMLSGKPYPIKAMIIAGSNPLNKHTNTKMVYEAMKKLDS